jgi:putative glycerol-1-phosphate prenyltransferase
LSKHADGLFLPSLLSGRNPDYLIEIQIRMAPIIKKMKLPSVPMAYLLINSTNTSSTQNVTNTLPLDISNTAYIIHTAIAAELLGFKLLYLEAGSGATKQISASLIKKIKPHVSMPIIVGGGIDSKQKAKQAIDAGANMLVVGNALEKNVYLLTELSACF